ncbi:hypothetical protein [Magnetofaba australis]|nr:hypothetical protein [Magnetofaba australis]
MARQCTVCAHRKLNAIDEALVAGESMAGLAKRYKLSRDALRRHRDSHLPEVMVKSEEAQQTARGDSLIDQLKALQTRAHNIAMKAEKEGDLRAALAGIRELVRIVELLGKLQGELESGGPVVNVSINAEWVEIRAVVLSALAPYPDARQAVAKALSAKTGGAS